MLHPQGLSRVTSLKVVDERKQRHGFKASPHQHLTPNIFTIMELVCLDVTVAGRCDFCFGYKQS